MRGRCDENETMYGSSSSSPSFSLGGKYCLSQYIVWTFFWFNLDLLLLLRKWCFFNCMNNGFCYFFFSYRNDNLNIFSSFFSRRLYNNSYCITTTVWSLLAPPQSLSARIRTSLGQSLRRCVRPPPGGSWRSACACAGCCWRCWHWRRRRRTTPSCP